jgi:1-acyl-sn-glycerol-3-phosphate acyltransferase
MPVDLAMMRAPRELERSACVARVAEVFSEWGAGRRDALQRLFERSLAGFSEQELAQFAHRLDTTGSDWGYHAPDPVARSLSRLVHGLVAGEGSALLDDGGLAVARHELVVFLGNHLSFIDANTVDFLLHRHGWTDVADRITVLVGPKVFAQPVRRLASLCFGAIKMPQSTTRASGEAVMSRRETLRLAGQALANARERRAGGDHLLIFSEGSRSRSGAMQRALPAVARYLEEPFATLVPFGVWGTEKIVTLDEDHAHVHAVSVHVGRALAARELFERSGGRRALIADAIGFLTADLLPPAYRGWYAKVGPELAEARALASAVS